jgi:hypothetical protein
MRARTSERGRGWLAAVALGAALAGCVTEELTIKLPRPEAIRTGSRRGEGREILLLGPLASRRPQPRCGMRKNGYNADVASIRCDEAPELAIARLLFTELGAAGFKVLTDPAKAGPSTIAISALLEQAFFEPKLNYSSAVFETDVALTLTAQTRTGLVATRRFYVKGEEATYWGQKEDIERSWQSAIIVLVANVVGAVANLADEFPAAPAEAGR